MNRDQAQAAVDEAFCEGVKKLYAVLAQAFMSDPGHDEALNRFISGLSLHDEVHAKASHAVEKIFPE